MIHCCTLITQGADTFLKNNFVTFVSTFLIGRAICHFRYFFRMQDFSSNISERGNIWFNDLYFCVTWPLKTSSFALKCDYHPLNRSKKPYFALSLSKKPCFIKKLLTFTWTFCWLHLAFWLGLPRVWKSLNLPQTSRNMIGPAYKL